MTKVKQRVKRRNMVAHDMLTSGLYRHKVEKKNKYKRKQKHKKVDDV